VLGLIFLAYAEHRFEQVRPELEAKATPRRPVTPDDYRRPLPPHSEMVIDDLTPEEGEAFLAAVLE